MANKVIAGTATGATALPVANSIDGSNDYLPIYTANVTATQAINRNTFLNLGSAPVGLTDSQTLTNKVLTSPTISGPTLSGTVTGTYIIGGSPTFPTSVVTLTGSQTLTNKTITSPTINSPTITNATFSADAVTGFTVSNSGTIYGIGVTLGQITGANTITSGAIATNAVSGANLATNAITLGYAKITGNATTTSASFTATGLTSTVTVPAGGRNVKVTFFCSSIQINAGSGAVWAVAIYKDGNPIQQGYYNQVTSGYNVPVVITAVDAAPSSGSHTYDIRYASNGSNIVTINAAAGTSTTPATAGPAFILVEAI